jgi:predicted HicB family RNase H-like nuclease
MTERKTFLMRVEARLHRRWKAKATAAGLDLNSFLQLILRRAEDAGLMDVTKVKKGR